MARAPRRNRSHLLRQRSRDLRTSATDAEAALWRALRARRLLGFKFRRQVPVGPFILDLYCASERLAIEVDGGEHALMSQAAEDEARTRFLAERGVRVLRFWNHEVLQEMEGVLERIYEALVRGAANPSFDAPHPL